MGPSGDVIINKDASGTISGEGTPRATEQVNLMKQDATSTSRRSPPLATSDRGDKVQPTTTAVSDGLASGQMASTQPLNEAQAKLLNAAAATGGGKSATMSKTDNNNLNSRTMTPGSRGGQISGVGAGATGAGGGDRNTSRATVSIAAPSSISKP